MDGDRLIKGLARVLQEDIGTSGFLNPFTSYKFLNEAAREYARRTKSLTNTTTITTVANQTNYDLPVDFYGTFVTDTFNRPQIKINDGSSDSWVTFRDYDAVYFGNITDAAPIPYNFSVIDKTSPGSAITGTTTAVGAASNGECTLTDSTAPFGSVAVGDEVHNLTDGSDGVVIAVTSSSALVCALFNGTNNDWTSADAYVVVPQGRWQLVLNPPPSVSGYTVTVTYYAKPAPVYSPYRAFRFTPEAEIPLINYAAWLYKYRDRDPNMGDTFYRLFEMGVRRAVASSGRALNRFNFHVNLTQRGYADRSYR